MDNQFIPLIGNGICDDVTNIEECVFDGGDCIQNGRGLDHYTVVLFIT